MKYFISIFSVLVILTAATSCNSDQQSASSAYDLSETSSADSAGTSSEATIAAANAAPEKPLALADPARKIIKTADLRCRVADVLAATTHIERLAAEAGGQIAHSRLQNATDAMRTLPYKPDSLKQVASYTTTASLTLRIPVARLDTVLSDIAGSAAFINARNLHLDDVTLRYLSNKLKNDALAVNDAAQQAKSLARKSRDAVYAGDYTDEQDERRIDRHIENMQLTDQVTYASLTVDLYQPERISQTIVPDIDHLMRPTLGQQAGLALSSGWELLRTILIGILHIWPLVLISLAGWTLYRYRRAKKLVVRAQP